MMTIPTYIVNLKTSTARKEYMENLLSGFSRLDIRFIEAVDGRLFSEEERNQAFDMHECVLRNGREINAGEIGCTLSHRKCYRMLVDSGDKYALILEDDISIVGDMDRALSDEVIRFMSCDKPRILFLSGDYWYWKRKNISRVCWAVGSYAYYINRAAASRILRIKKPFNVADDWDLYKAAGVGLFALHPYVVDANITDLPSDIQQNHWGNLRQKMSFNNIFRSYKMGIIKKCLCKIGHFESKIRND